MANRVLAGNRSSGGYGLYVSKSGDNVLDTTNPLQFDPRSGASIIVQSYGQGTILSAATVTITHNLGYKPCYAVRWSDSSDISSGLATAVYTPGEYDEVDESFDGEDYSERQVGIRSTISTSTLVLRGNWAAAGDARISGSGNNNRTIYYAFVIFHEADFTNGRSL